MREKIFSGSPETSGAIFGEAPIEEPYAYVEKGSFSGEEQAASPAAFGNYDFVLKNLRYTAVRSNGIESYELYWILSLIDYYEYSGDAVGTESLLSEATERLDHAYEIYGTKPSLSFLGWDERRVLPEYIRDVRFSKGHPVTLTADSDDERALSLKASGAGSRFLGAYQSEDDIACCQTFTVDIDLREEWEYTVALYFADWDCGGRELMVEVFDGQTKNLIAPLQALHDYRGGVYLVYRYDRSIRFRINHIRGENVSLCGIFFGEKKQ